MKKSEIFVKENIFQLNTPGTSYIFGVGVSGHLEQLYYGKRIKNVSETAALEEKLGTGLGTSVFYSADTAPLSLNNCAQEVSTTGKGDFREPFLILRDLCGGIVNDFLFEGYEITDGFYPAGLPSAHGKAQTLVVTTTDKTAKLTLKLFYSIFADCDVIVKSAALTNGGEAVDIEKIASCQLDLPESAFDLVTLDGAWAKERYVNTRPLSVGTFTVDSKVGFSSNTHNPFIMLKRRGSSLFSGDSYAFNLVYSGNHCETVEVTPHEKTRVLTGINPFGFSWRLGSGKTFFTPEAAVCYSPLGSNGITQEFHKFVNEHIVRGAWAKKERPVLVNNWEATMFNFTEEQLLKIAAAGREIGAELFVLDDGWFGSRTDDTRGLGDWHASPERFPDGLNAFAAKIKELGLDFGIWVEPEMVNPNSDLYRAHPDWAVTHPRYAPSLGRNQLLLDLANGEVRKYLIDSMTEVFGSADISYVKWDFNRPMSDFYSNVLGDRQGEFFHRYTLGLYEILEELAKRFPEILFESCASGGNRVDLGMLCYMPQFWASDNTDSYDRALIQAGTLLAYPVSTMGAHVSGAPNAQTLRTSTIDNRFNTACFGLLGYELDLTKLNPHETAAVKKQVDFYIKYRRTIQFGDYYVIKDIFTERTGQIAVVGKDKKQALACITNNIAVTSPPSDILRFCGLEEDARYTVTTRQQSIPAKSFGELIYFAMPMLAANPEFAKLIESGFMLPLEKETYAAYGDLLMNAGIKLNQQYSSSGYNPSIRIMQDFGNRIYAAEMVED